MIEFKSPSQDHVAMMQEFADKVAGALEVIEKYEMNNVLVKVADKLQESMHWFQSGVLNDALKVREIAVATPEEPKILEGEIVDGA